MQLALLGHCAVVAPLCNREIIRVKTLLGTRRRETPVWVAVLVLRRPFDVFF